MLVIKDKNTEKVFYTLKQGECTRIVCKFEDFIKKILLLDKKSKISIDINGYDAKKNYKFYKELYFIFDKDCSHIIEGLSFKENVHYWSKLYHKVDLYPASKAFWKIQDNLDNNKIFSEKEKHLLELSIMLSCVPKFCIVEGFFLKNIEKIDKELYKKAMKLLSNRAIQGGMVLIIEESIDQKMDHDIKEYFDLYSFQ